MAHLLLASSEAPSGFAGLANLKTSALTVRGLNKPLAIAVVAVVRQRKRQRSIGRGRGGDNRVSGEIAAASRGRSV